MPERPPLPPGPYLVVGLRRSGLAAAHMLAAHGEVIGVDSGAPELDEAPGFEAHTGADGVDLLDRVATVVKSPGVPWSAPVVAAAAEQGMLVTGELELAWRLLEGHPFVAVTGTNGKTTTVELLGAIWRCAGLGVEVAGNVGRPVSDLVGLADPGATVVCEASSFQLEDSSALTPDVALLLNVEEDHLDRHGDMERYLHAKLRAFANQGPDSVAVAPPSFEVPGQGRRVTFGAPGADVLVEGGRLVADGELLVETQKIRLRGAHNLENAMGAVAVALARGVPRPAVVEALTTFAGVEHRLEEVATVGRVLYVNDSKATNPASAARGIESFPGGVHVILGGSLKGGGFAALREPVRQRCTGAYLIGEAAPALATDLAGTIPLHEAGTLKQAVGQAAAAAQPGDVVLLSPACASFDAFADYEARGARFRQLVSELG